MSEYKIHENEPSIVSEPDYAGEYTAGDYIKWTFEGLYELIRGTVYKMSPAPNADHQRVSSNLVHSFHKNFEGRSCEIFHAPFDVYLIHAGEDWQKAKNILEPDLCVICDKNKIKHRGCIGAPDLVVEILSPSTAKRDTNNKFFLYEEYGVREYWIVHPRDQTVLVNVLENGKYKTLRLLTKGQMLQSTTFPFLTVDLAAVFPEIDFED
jgi:Uma2 family endonuclease